MPGDLLLVAESFFDKLIVCIPGQEFSEFYGTWRFIIFQQEVSLVCTLCQILQSTLSHPNSLRSILLFFHLYIGFSTKTLYAFLLSPTWMTCPVDPFLLDIIIIIITDENKLWCSKFCNFLQPPYSSSFWDPNLT